MPLSVCPSEEELKAFQRGELPVAAVDTIADHLDHCPRCEAIAQRLDSEIAPPLALLRGQTDLSTSTATPLDRTDSTTSPRFLGPYQLLEELGRGGMGVVFRARHTHLDKLVALKMLDTERTRDARAVVRFHREMKALGKLSHPHLVQATDAGKIDGVHFLVMEFLDGQDVAQLATRLGLLPVADACAIARQAALGLQFAHEHGLIHRDVKPSNLMLTSEGQLKVMDLGLALFQDAIHRESTSTSSGLVMGSFDYIAPEQAKDSHAVDHRADLYSLGCTLFHLLTGQVPFPAPEYETPLQKVSAHMHKPPPVLRKLRGEVPNSLARVVSRLLAKEPADRFATAAEVARVLAPFAAGADLTRLLDPTRTARSAARVKAKGSLIHSRLFWAATALFLLTGLLLTGRLLRQ